MRKPYFWKAKQAWYVRTADFKSQVYLGKTEEEAYDAWQEMRDAESPESSNATFLSLANAFLGWARRNLSAKGHRSYSDFLVRFCEAIGTLPARELKPYHVTRWLDSETSWGAPDTRRGAIAAVKRCIHWSIDEGLLDRNPLAGLKKPKGKRREQLVDDEHHAGMMQAKDGGRRPGKRADSLGLKPRPRDACFRLVLIALRHAGVRPGTIGAVRIEDVSADGTTWTVRQHKTRNKTGKPLVVYLSPCLQTVTRIAREGRTSGPLFLNSKGKPWTSDAIGRRVKNLRDKLKLPDGTVPYAYRHSYATQALMNGTDLATVAELLGHSDLKMMAQHYGHLDKQADHLKQAAAQAVKKRA